ncbi:hypothetical protein AUO94_15300 [Planococcus kocurii]|uniref:Uncharacterized protein n=1 Tax=Planococcus kocurii TaxID=1374 RepID=A0ABM5WZW9_9BACL|nr:hypothetical protein AUO94_15300 [Planococcus kocurii]
MSLESGRWSLDIEKRKRPCRFDKRWKLGQSWRFSAISGQAEATRGAGRWSLDNKKSASARVGSTGIRQTGEAAHFAAQLGWLMTLESGRWSLDTKKRKRPKV